MIKEKMPGKTKIFLNLTNGIEAIERFGLKLEDVSFIRLQSCHCESKKFVEILKELDYNFLMHLAMGFRCVVYDFGAKSPTSKALYIGLTWVKYALYRRWFGKIIPVEIKGWDLSQRFDMFYKKIDDKTKRKLDYFKKYLFTEEILIETVSDATINDNKPGYFRSILEKELFNSQKI